MWNIIIFMASDMISKQSRTQTSIGELLIPSAGEWRFMAVLQHLLHHSRVGKVDSLV